MEDIDSETVEENLGEIVPGLVRVKLCFCFLLSAFLSSVFKSLNSMHFFYLLPPSRTHHLNISQDTLILFTLQKFA